jgi:circularin A/uberolysin family circular bacteriocin
MQQQTKSPTASRVRTAVLAVLVSTAGLASASIGVLWVMGSLGISAAAASQIVDAILVGGWALTVVMAIFGGGIISAIMATVRYLAGRLGRAAAVA